MISEKVISKLPGKRWTKGDKDRLYVKASEEEFGILTTFYHTGNISTAEVLEWEPLEGVDMDQVNEYVGGISNRKALKLLNSEAYLDIKTGKIHYDSEWLKERFRYLIVKAEAEVKAEEEAEVEEAEEDQARAEARISLPSTDQGLKNLMALAKRYGDLLQKSTGFSGLRVTEDGLIFEGMDAENEAHKMLLDYMKKFAEASKGIKEKEALHAENEKFTFRTWLLRMEWKGRETSELRTSLYKGLSGNSAFCTEGSKERWMEKHGRASTPRQ